MATVTPFKGIRYNPDMIDNSTDVATPPYDVISPEAQRAFYHRHPNNVIRLILNPGKPTDTAADNPHTRSAACFRQWMEQGVLIREDQPALYLKSIGYRHGGETCRRYGLIAQVGLEPFEKRIILPHEKTFSKIRSERLELMKATHCNYCPIFSLYPDESGILSTLIEAVDPNAPIVDFIDDDNHRHQLWRILDPAVHRQVTDTMQNKRLFIADGHHRYETALEYRNDLKANDPSFDAAHPANHVLMYLSSMSDPGLIILPAHRLLKAIGPEDLQRTVENARTYFDVADFPFTPEGRKATEQKFFEALGSEKERPCIGIYGHKAPVFHLLKLKAGVMEKCFGEKLDASLQSLDVTVLTRLVFMNILGFDQQRLDDATRIGYASEAEKALQSIDNGAYDVAFILNPTRIEQVQEVARKGLVMPRKSTYFYPKVKSGLVMRTLGE